MKTSRFASMVAVAAVVFFLGSTPTVRADDLKVDPVHSSLAFMIHHLNAGNILGTFLVSDGSITTDADPTKTTFTVNADVSSIDTRNQKRDDDLKGADWLDAKQFPTMSFKSTSAKSAGDNKLEVTGDFTLHGVTKSITVTIENTGTGQGMKGETRVGYLAMFTINRSDYGVASKMPATVAGEEVKIMVALEAIKQ